MQSVTKIGCISNDAEFVASLEQLSQSVPAAAHESASEVANESKDEMLVLSNCKRKHELLELGTSSRFRDELDYMTEGLYSSSDKAVLGSLDELQGRVLRDPDFATRMRVVGSPQGIYDVLAPTIASRLAVCKKLTELLLELARNLRRVDFILKKEHWIELLGLQPNNAELAKKILASGIDICIPNALPLLETLIRKQEWDVLDACWQNNPDGYTKALSEELLKQVILSKHLRCMVTLSGTEIGPLLIHKIVPDCFAELLAGELDYLVLSIMINLVDRVESCPHRALYATLAESRFDSISVLAGMGSVLALLLNQIDPISCELDSDQLAFVRNNVNEFIGQVRQEGKAKLADEMTRLLLE